MLILEEMALSQEFADIFLSKVGLSGAKVVEVEHSKMDVELGETDITVIVQNGDSKHGLLIEDKIDAIAQPEQCKRYDERGKLGVKNNDYDSYDVFIVAPQKYITDNEEASKYSNKVLYEELVNYNKLLAEQVIDEQEYTTLKAQLFGERHAKGACGNVDELKKWRKLADQKIISDSEYSAMKAKILKIK